MDEQTPNETAPSGEPKYPLDAGELEASIEIEEAGRKHRLKHFFRPFTRDDWQTYARLLAVTLIGRKGEKGVETDIAQLEAIEWLWTAAVTRVEGYTDVDENFRERMPLSHMRAAIENVTQCFPVVEEAEDEPEGAPAPGPSLGLSLGFGGLTVVKLEAARNGVEYPELIHRFRRPSASQVKKYRRSQSRETVIGGQRGKEKNKWRSITHAELAPSFALYDELVAGVEGYEPNEPSRMDPVHIDVALKELMGNA